MNPRTLAAVLAVCISLLVLSVIVRTEMYVAEALLPLAETPFVQVVE